MSRSVSPVSCTRCLVEYSTIVRPGKYVVRILKEGGTRPTSANVFDHNLIVCEELSETINVGGEVDLNSFAFSDNYWYNPSTPAQSRPRFPLSERDPAGGADPQLDRSHRPAAGSPAADHGAFAKAVPDERARHASRFSWAWEQAQPFVVRP